MNELKCPKCEHEFLVEDYDSGDCPNCDEAHYYWDSVYDEEENVEYFEEFYWENNE